MKQMTLGSLFDGIGGWQIAAVRAGVKPLWSSEIEKFPCAVTAKHFPEVKQLGDITKLDGAKLPPVDIICSGSPCQSFSIAGKHTGLDGVSGIFYEFVRVVKEMQEATNGIYPKFVVWENVPGAFSSDNGKDIQAVLNAFDDLGYVLDMNILDAQYMGVPQRRRRIFAVWQNVNIIRQMKTDTSFSIITQLLTEILLCILNETLNLSEKGRKDSAWRQRKLSEDGLLKKMKLFGIVEKPKFEKLLNDWEGTLQKQLQEQASLDALSDEKGERLHGGMTKLELIRQLDGERFGSIDTLWKNLLADLYKKEKSYTTLTTTSEITDQTICTCAKILESISWLTIRLTKLSANFCETEQFVSMARKELTKYANERQCSYSLFEPMDRVQRWNDYLTMVSDARQSVVADFGGQSAGEILFERKSLFGHTAKSEEAREGAAAGTESGVGGASGIVAAGFKHKASGTAGSIGYQKEQAPTLMEGQQSAVAVYDMTHADEVMRRIEGGKCQTLNARMGTGGNQVPVITYSIAGNIIGREDWNGGHQMGIDKETSYTLNTVDRHAVCVGNGQLAQARLSDKVGTLNCMHDQQCVMNYCPQKIGALCARDYKEIGNQYVNDGKCIVQKSVRRLTPTECERLQGLPDVKRCVAFDLQNERLVMIEWLGYQNINALSAVEKCLKKQKRVGSAESDKLQQSVSFAEKNLQPSNQSISKRVQKNARIFSEASDQETRSLLEKLRTVCNVGENLEYHRRNQTTNFVPQNAPMNLTQENIIHNGEEGLQQKEEAIPQEDFGNTSLKEFGREIDVLAKGAEKYLMDMDGGSRFIMFDLTATAKKQDMMKKILSYFVQSVTRLHIQTTEQIVVLLLEPKGYTLIDDKSCSDTARYKALGNGMAQPVADWVMKRIKEVVDGDGILEKSND